MLHNATLLKEVIAALVSYAHVLGGVACGDKLRLLLSHSVLLNVTFCLKDTTHADETQIFPIYEGNCVSVSSFTNLFLSIFLYEVFHYYFTNCKRFNDSTIFHDICNISKY